MLDATVGRVLIIGDEIVRWRKILEVPYQEYLLGCVSVGS